MRRAASVMTFLAGLGIGFAVMGTVALRSEQLAAREARARAEEERIRVNLATQVPADPSSAVDVASPVSPPQTAAEASSPFDLPSAVTPPTTLVPPSSPFDLPGRADPSLTAITNMGEVAPDPNPPQVGGTPGDPSALIASRPPEAKAEEFVAKTREELESRLQDLQSEKKALEERLGKIEKYSRLMKSLLSAFDEKQGIEEPPLLEGNPAIPPPANSVKPPSN